MSEHKLIESLYQRPVRRRSPQEIEKERIANERQQLTDEQNRVIEELIRLASGVPQEPQGK